MPRSILSRVASAMLFVVGFFPAAATARLYVADNTLNQINIYPTGVSGNTAPSIIIAGAATGLSSPYGIATDANFIYVGNYQNSTITIYSLNASGNAAPVRTIGGGATGLAGPVGIAVDANYIYVVNEEAVIPISGLPPGAGSITVYPLSASGNAAPVATIGGYLTDLALPFGIAVDANYIYVAVPGGDASDPAHAGTAAGGEVNLYPLNANGDVVPSIIISDAAQGLHQPAALAVDGTNLYVANEAASFASVVVYPLAGLSSASTPSVTLSGASTNLSGPNGIAVDSGQMYLRNSTTLAITDYPIAASGNTAPSSTLSGSNAGIEPGLLLTVDGSVTAPATHFLISAPASATANAPFNITITALDASNNSVPTYSGTVHFTSTDPLAILPANTTLTAGTGTLSVTLKTGGNQTVSAADTLTTSITGISAAVVVAGGAATHFTLVAPTPETAGTPGNVTVTALDAFNNLAAGYAGTVAFSSTDGSAVLPSGTTLTSGVGIVSVTFKTAGFQTVTATDTVAGSITGTSNYVSVNPGAATHFSVVAPASTTAGNGLDITVTALDAANNTATGYAGTLHFTSSDGAGTLPANATLTAGAGSFNFIVLRTAGVQTITATDTVTASITGTSAGITVGPGGATHLSVSAPGSATAGTPISVTVTALDGSNNVSTFYSGTVHFTSTDLSAALPANATLTAGAGTFSATLETIGGQTVTATDTVSGSINGTSGTITVSSGAPTTTHFSVSVPGTATAGTPISVTVTALSSSNAIVTSYAGTVHFTSSDGSAFLPANATLTSGTGTFSVTLGTAGGQTVTATDTVTGSITGTSGSVTVSAAPATHFSVSAPGTATAGTPISVTVTALNSSNTIVTGYAGIVHFTSSDGSAFLPANTTLTSGTGTFSVTLGTAGGQTVTATDTVTGSITGTSGSVTVSAAPATHFSVSAPGTATAGTPISVTVTALNSSNTIVTGYAGIVHFTSSDGSAFLPANTTLTSGTGTFTVTLGTVGGQTVTATDTVTGSITGTSSSVTVSAVLPATHFSVSVPGTATTGTPISVTVTALNSSNTIVTGYAGIVHFTSSDGSAFLPANTTLASGTGTFSVTLGTAGGQTVTATDTVTGSITGTSSSVIVSAPPPATTHFSVSAPGTATAGTPISVTVTALSASNSIVTGYAGIVHFTSSDGSAFLPANTTLSSGTGTFAVTLGTAGSQTVTATDTVTGSITGTSNAVAVAVGTAVGVGGIGGGAGIVTGSHGISPDATGASSGIAVTLTGNTGTMVGYIASISSGFTANFTLAGGSFTTTTTALTGGASLGQTLTLSGTLSGGVLSGTIQPLGLPFSVTLDSATGASAAVAGLYQASSSTSGSVTYSIVGTQGELFVLAITPGLVSAGTGTVTSGDTFSVTTSQGTTISGSVSAGTSVLGETVTPAGGSAISFSGLSAGDSPTAAPVAQTVLCGSTATLTVTTSLATPTYQWQFNGVPIAGATGATLNLPLIGMTQAGTYAAVVTAGGTSAISNAATVTVTSNAWLANLSCRAYVAPATNPADVLISGFVTTGSSSKQLLVRGIGPGLQQFGIPSFLPNPALTIYSGSTPGSTLTSWSASLSTLFASLGAFPLAANSADAATSNAYNPGVYTAMVTAADGKQSGVALVEVYDADRGAPANRLVNLSGRAFVGTGANVLAGGFVVGGTNSETLLIRAVGPQLGAAPFNVPGTLAKPLLQVYDTGAVNHLIAQIQGWGGAPTPGNSPVSAGLQPATAAVMTSVGAFGLTNGSADSAMVLVLPAGAAFTVQVSGADGGSGIALLEIYEVP